MRGKVTAVVVALVLCACGDDGSASPDSEDAGGTSGGGAAGTGGGTAGAGGASGGAAGAEDGGGAAGGGAVARGAVSLHILSPTGCSLPDQFQDLPQLASGHPVTDAQKVQAVEDGSVTADGKPVRVLCNWLGEQSPYILDAVLEIGAATDERGLNLGFTMTPGQTDTGGLVFWSPEFPADYGARAEPCMYSVIEFDETTRSVWGSLACSSFAPLDGTDSCALGPSYFFFENCTIVRPPSSP